MPCLHSRQSNLDAACKQTAMSARLRSQGDLQQLHVATRCTPHWWLYPGCTGRLGDSLAVQVGNGAGKVPVWHAVCWHQSACIRWHGTGDTSALNVECERHIGEHIITAALRHEVLPSCMPKRLRHQLAQLSGVLGIGPHKHRQELQNELNNSKTFTGGRVGNQPHQLHIRL